MATWAAVSKGKDLGGCHRHGSCWQFIDGLDMDGAEELLLWLAARGYARPGCSGLQEDGTYTVYWHI
jgi:hypothetical protein